MEVVNKTCFEAEHFSAWSATGAETAMIVVKGTWTIGHDGQLSLADRQVPVLLAPQYYGEPGLSSLRYNADSYPGKPGTDCILSGHARAPEKKTSVMEVTFAVGPVRRTARVFGKRRWLKHLIGAPSISQPEAFETIPLTWEHSFGGTDCSGPATSDHDLCGENPVGMGFMAPHSRLDLESLALPQVENPADLISTPHRRPMPWGFAAIPQVWQPRAGYAGTYDDNWRRTRMPLPPVDQDPRFYSSASPGLCSSQYLSGSESVVVAGAWRSGRLHFELPGTVPNVSILCGNRCDELPVHLDTVLVEPDEDRLILVWKGAVARGKRGEQPSIVMVK